MTALTSNRMARRIAASRARRGVRAFIDDPRRSDLEIACALPGVARTALARAAALALLEADGAGGALVHTFVRRDVRAELDTPIACADNDDNTETTS